jgi:5-methylthioadenosine/S-adenosylhomocysteine deaminase
MASTLLFDATILTVDAHDTILDRAWISVEDGRITGLGSRDACPDAGGFDEAIDCSGRLVMPGLVNAHTHSAMILFRGRAEGQSLLTMAGWYAAIREPELAMKPEDVGPAVELSCAEMLLSGTTTFCDQYFYADEIASAAATAEMRAVIAYGVVQLGDVEKGREELDKAIRFLQGRHSADGRIIPWLGPHAPYVDNSEDILKAEAEAALRHGAGLHLHMAAGPEDNEDTLARYGLTATAALARDGFFAARVHAAHCLDLSDDDIAIFARAPKASVAHCASASLRSGRKGICPVKSLREAGVVVALGTDNVAANNSYDMIAEMRIAGLLAGHREGIAQVISSTELIRMATIDGARALGLDHDIGSLEVGKAADLVSIDIEAPGYSDCPDIPALLVYSGSGRDVRDVWVGGERLVRDRQLTRRPYHDIRVAYRAAYDVFWSRVAERKHAA